MWQKERCAAQAPPPYTGWRSLRRSEKAAVLAAAAVCPLVNTGVLYLVLALFFDTAWSAVLSAFMSINFLLELTVNIVLAPTVLRIVTMRRRAA